MLSQASIRPSGEYAGEIFVRHLQSVNCAIFLKRMKQIGKDMAAAQQELSSLVSQLTGDAYAVKALKELTEMEDWEQNITK